MAQNRKPPAYQEYAASILADRNFRLMTLAERGLLYTLRLECWQNVNVPANPKELAKYFGYEASEIEATLSQNVKGFFEQRGSDLICPEIEDYRQHVKDIRKKQSEGGKKGAQKVNAKHQNNVANTQVPRQVSREFLVQSSLDKFSKHQSLDNGDITIDESQQWINDYDQVSNG